MDQGIGGMCRHRRLGKAAEDQLQLARIMGNVADGEDARQVGYRGRRVDDARSIGRLLRRALSGIGSELATGLAVRALPTG